MRLRNREAPAPREFPAQEDREAASKSRDGRVVDELAQLPILAGATLRKDRPPPCTMSSGAAGHSARSRTNARSSVQAGVSLRRSSTGPAVQQLRRSWAFIPLDGEARRPGVAAALGLISGAVEVARGPLGLKRAADAIEQGTGTDGQAAGTAARQDVYTHGWYSRR